MRLDPNRGLMMLGKFSEKESGNLFFRFVIFLLFFVISCSNVYSLNSKLHITQAFQRIWQVQQGIPDATILSICQTGQEYIWLGTPSGLVRFDGSRFAIINRFDGINLDTQWIKTLVEDAQHHLWFANDGAGVVQVRDGKAHLFNTASGLPSSVVHSMAADLNGGMWVGTEKGVAHIEHDKVTTYAQEERVTHDRVTALAVDENGSVWIAGEGAVLVTFKDGQFTSVKLTELVPSSRVTALLCTDDGTIWIGTTNGLFSWKKGVERRFAVKNGLLSSWITSIAGGRDGVVWVGTDNGFSRVRDGEVIDSFGIFKGLSHRTVNAIMEDHEGSLWVGTKQGLNQFVERRAVPFTTNEGLPSNRSGPICQDSSDTVWSGTLDAGLAYFDGDRFVSLSSKDGLVGNQILASPKDQTMICGLARTWDYLASVIAKLSR